jgi:hypothetical protein
MYIFQYSLTNGFQFVSGLMDRQIARLNIEHFRKALADEADEAKRRTLHRLLSEEEAKLAALDRPGNDHKNRC